MGVEAGAGGGDPDLLVGRLRLADPDVVGDRPGYHHGLLEDDAEPAPKRGQREAAQADAVEGDPARRRVVHPHQHLEHGALATAAGADEGHLGAARDHGVDAFQDIGARAVGEIDALQPDLLLQWGQVHRTGGVGHARPLPEHVEGAL